MGIVLMDIEFFIFACGLGCRTGNNEPRFLKNLAGKPLLEQQLRAVGSVPEVNIIHVIAGYQHPVLDEILATVPARSRIILHRNPAFSNGDVTGVLWEGELAGFPPPLPKSDDISFCRGMNQNVFYRFLAGGKNDFLPINVYCEEIRKLVCLKNFSDR